MQCRWILITALVRINTTGYLIYNVEWSVGCYTLATINCNSKHNIPEYFYRRGFFCFQFVSNDWYDQLGWWQSLLGSNPKPMVTVSSEQENFFVVICKTYFEGRWFRKNFDKRWSLEQNVIFSIVVMRRWHMWLFIVIEG